MHNFKTQHKYVVNLASNIKHFTFNDHHQTFRQDFFKNKSKLNIRHNYWDNFFGSKECFIYTKIALNLIRKLYTN